MISINSSMICPSAHALLVHRAQTAPSDYKFVIIKSQFRKISLDVPPRKATLPEPCLLLHFFYISISLASHLLLRLLQRFYQKSS